MVKHRRLLSIGLTLPLSMASALFMGMSSPAADVGLSPVTIDCGDGAPIYTSVDATQLTRLQSVITAMVEAGQPCVLRQESHDPSQEAKAMMVGAGVYGTVDGCPERFTVKAHEDSQGFHGVQTFRFIGTDPLCNTGSLEASVLCLQVSGNVGEARGIVQESGGGNISDFAPPGTVWGTDGTDSPDGLRDMVTQFIDDPGTERACSAQGGTMPLDRGNIQVGGASS